MLCRSRSRSARHVFSTTPACVERLETRALLSAGALDRSFGGDGIVTTALQGYNVAGAVNVRPDGTIVFLGTTSTDAGFAPPDPERVILHYKPSGSWDGSFGDGGIATIDVPVLSDNVIDLSTAAFQADGKILVGGQSRPSDQYDDFLVVRLNADGSRDSSFGNDGYATIDLLTRESVTGVAVAPNGKIVVTGYTTLPTADHTGQRVFVAIRLNADGSLDSSFGDAGHVELDGITGTPSDVGVQPDGKIVLIGQQSVARLTAEGSLDAAFGGDGIVQLSAGFDARSLAVLPNGRLLVAGTAATGNGFAVARLASDGSLDNAFGNAGWATVGFGSTSVLHAMAVQADGRIVLAGSVDTELVDVTFGPFQNSDFAVARLNSDGSLDTSFGNSGRQQVPVDAGDQQGQRAVARAVAIQPDGRIVLAGDSLQDWAGLHLRNSGPFALVRLLSGNEPRDFDILGRASGGNWWTSGFNNDGGVLENSVFSSWAPSVNWKHVRTGDFDGDGLTDVAGWDPASGYWWESLSDGGGSTVQRAGFWSNATQWFDVAAVNLAAAGDSVDQGHFTHKSDLVGRDQWGNWWAAVANSDGTFSNVLLANWNGAASWADTQFLDVNSDGQTDIVSRAAGGWWGLISQNSASGGFSYQTVLLATWVGSAGWHDALTADGLFGDGQPAIAARTSGGAWWALEFAADGTATKRSVSKWNEAAGWRDVQAADLDGDGSDEIIGRTSTGEWWDLAFNASASAFDSRSIGVWNEAAGWHDVQTVALDDRDVLVARQNSGDWRLSEIAAGSDDLTDRLIGHWNPAADWKDVHIGTFVRPPVALVPGDSGQPATVQIFGDRRGTSVLVQNSSRTNGASGIETGLLVTRTAAGGAARQWFFATPPTTTLEFIGHVAVDDFDNESRSDSIAHGLGGDDILDGRDNGAFDQLFGGDGLDTLLGDGSDLLVQDPAMV